MKIHKMVSGKPVWSAWKELADCSEENRKQANLRQIKPTEIVLDTDKTPLSEVTAKLKKGGINFQAYKHRDGDTGHVHAVFPEMAEYNEGDRKLIREIFIRKFKCDIMKSSENGLIAWKGRPHWKTGRIKTLVEEVPGDNKLPEWVLDSFHAQKAKITAPIDINELLNGVPEGKRNWATVVLATYMRKQGIPIDSALEKLQEWNAKNNPPYPGRELEATVKYTYARKRPYGYKFRGDAGSNRISRLVGYIQNNATLFSDQFNEAYVLLNCREVYPIRSRGFKIMLSKLFWDREGVALDTNTINSAINVLEAKARYEGHSVNLSTRISWHNGRIFYDLGERQWKVIEISPTGWKVTDEHPPLFRRYSHQHEQAEPKAGEYKLDNFVSLTAINGDDSRLLFKVVIISYFIPDIPHPIIIPYGPQGSGKTFTQGIIRSLVDPSAIETLTFPRDKNELIQMLSHHYCAMFDNVSLLRGEISDILCRAVTGSGFSKRALYTDDEDKIYHFKRVVGLNGINNPATKPDLLDRSVLFKLERIPKSERKREDELLNAFNEMKPSVLADIFDILSRALEIYPSIDLKDKVPRMADFAAWGEAISRAMGYGDFEFIRVYFRNIESQNAEAIEAHQIGNALIEFMKDKERWEGTATQLLEGLERVAERLKISIHTKTWPKAPNALARRMNEIRTNLADMGLQYKERRTMTSAIKALEWDKDKWEEIRPRERQTEQKDMYTKINKLKSKVSGEFHIDWFYSEGMNDNDIEEAKKQGLVEEVRPNYFIVV